RHWYQRGGGGSQPRWMQASEAGGDAAVDIEDVAVDEAGRVGGEEDRGACQFLDVAPAAGRRAVGEPARKRLVGDERGVQFRLEIAGADAVDLDAVAAPV